MKTASLLLAFPLLLPVCTTYAAPRDLRADGRYEFRENGVPSKYLISKDEVVRRGANGSERRVFLSERENLRNTQVTARQLSADTGDRVDMVAYPEGKIPSENNRRVVSRSLTLALADGIDPLVVASAVNASSFRSLAYAPGEYAFQFPDAQTALSAALDLKNISGVSNVTVELARKYYPRSTPTDPLFLSTTATKGQRLDVWYDFTNQKTMEPGVPWRLILNTQVNNYQWYLNNDGTNMDLTLFFPAFQLGTVGGVKIPDPLPDIYNPDLVPRFAVPNDFCEYNPYFDLAADINYLSVLNQTTTDGITPLTGAGVKVAVMDDGIQVNHEDLNASSLFDKNSSYNFINNDANPYNPADQTHFDPTPPAGGGNHGTGVAGIIFGRANTKGGIGVAPGATMIGYRFLGPFIEPSVIADMMAWGSTRQNPTSANGLPTGNEWRTNQVKFDVSVNAYGSASSEGTLTDMDPYYKKALAYGAIRGRNGKGVVYLFANGDAGDRHEDSNYTYLTNNRYSICVGSVSDMGRRVSYSDPGASVAVVAPSSGYEMAPAVVRADGKVFPANPLVVPTLDTDRILGYTVSTDDYDAVKSATTYARLRNSAYITTTDAAKSGATGIPNGYNKEFGGTSASVAMVGGVAALMLQANPNLGYRDVKEILMRSARVNDALYGEWSFNPLGMPMSHKYGAGLVDAGHAVAMAKVWVNVGPPNGTVIGNEYMGEVKTLPVGGSIFAKPGLDMAFDGPSGGLRVETVVVKLKIQHSRRGDLGIILTGPATGQADSAVESYLFTPHREDFSTNIGVVAPDVVPDDPNSNIEEFYEFTSVRHWGTASDNQPLKPDDGSGGGGWHLKIYDNTNYGKTGSSGTPTPPVTDPNSTKLVDGIFVDRVTVPVDNNSAAGKVMFASVTFHGSTTPSGNLPPTILPQKIVGRPGKVLYAPTTTSTDQDRAPILSYHFKVLPADGATEPTLFTSPNSQRGFQNTYPDPEAGQPILAKYPSFRFSPVDGILTNVESPVFLPSVQGSFATGETGKTTIVVHDLTGLSPGMFVVGKGIHVKAKIAPGGIDPVTGNVTLTDANIGTVNGFLTFTVHGPSTGLKGEFTVKMDGVEGLKAGMYVSGTNTGVGARIAPNGINTATKIVTLTAANADNVNEILFFSDLTNFADPPFAQVAATGVKSALKITVPDVTMFSKGAFVSGFGVGDGAQVVNTDAAAKTVTLSVANKDNVNNIVSLTNTRYFNTLVKGTWKAEVSATNIFGTTRKQIPVEIRDEVKYSEWVNTFYPPITDPNADPDGDGISNLMEFVSGSDPMVPDSFELPSSTMVNGKLVFRYQVDSNALAKTVTPELSSDLASWTDTTPVQAEKSGNLTFYTVTVDPTDPRKFFRLKAVVQ